MKEFQALKDKAHEYIILALSSDRQKFVVEKTSSSDNWDDFLGDLPESDFRHGVYDFQPEGKTCSRLLYITWCVPVYLCR